MPPSTISFLDKIDARIDKGSLFFSIGLVGEAKLRAARRTRTRLSWAGKTVSYAVQRQPFHPGQATQGKLSLSV